MNGGAPGLHWRHRTQAQPYIQQISSSFTPTDLGLRGRRVFPKRLSPVPLAAELLKIFFFFSRAAFSVM